MKRTHLITLILATILAAGCSSRSTPPPPLDLSMDLDAHEPEKLPYVDPSLPSGDLEKATDDLISKTNDAYEKVESLSEDEINFENVVQVFKASLF